MTVPLAKRESSTGSAPQELWLDRVRIAPPVALAPLAGITDLPFRQLVSSFGAGWVVSEMVASQEMVQAKPGVRERAELGYDQANTAVQIAGREAYLAGRMGRKRYADPSSPLAGLI